jgi:hypothetical protein
MKLSEEIKKHFFEALITACLATPIGLGFQWLYHRYENNLNIQQEERKVSLDFLMNVSNLMDERVYEMDKCYRALRNSASNEDIDQRWEEYKVSLNKWNGTLSKNLALAEFYFNKDIYAEFDTTHKSFVALGRILDDAKRRGIKGGKLKDLKTDFKELNDHMSSFLKKGLEEIYARGN